MHPDEMLAELLKTAGTRKRKSLEAIHATCQVLHERGSKDFSIPTVARLSQSNGGPVEGTIRNKTGDDYKALIKSWADYTGGVTRKIPRLAENPVMALVQKIDDPGVRSVMAGVLAENRKLRGEVNLLKNKASKSSYIDLRVSNNSSNKPVHILPASTGLLPSETEALRYAISEKKLIDEGWSVDNKGRVCNEKGRVIFPVGYLSGLRKIVA